MEVKEVIVNCKIIAKYSTDGKKLFLKVNGKLFKNAQIRIMENICTAIISQTEQIRFEPIGFLNVKF